MTKSDDQMMTHMTQTVMTHMMTRMVTQNDDMDDVSAGLRAGSGFVCVHSIS